VEGASAAKSHRSVLCFHISRYLLIAAFRANAAKAHFVRNSDSRPKKTNGCKRQKRPFMHPAANNRFEPEAAASQRVHLALAARSGIFSPGPDIPLS